MSVRPAPVTSPLDQLACVRPKALAMTELPVARPGALPNPFERRNLVRRTRLLNRIIAEFREMPGLSLTLPQARRLFGLPEEACARILGSLVRDGWLRSRGDGTYGRRDIRP